MSTSDDKLDDLRELLSSGAITREEYEALASAVLEEDHSEPVAKVAEPVEFFDEEPSDDFFDRRPAVASYDAQDAYVPELSGLSKGLRWGHAVVGGLTALSSLGGLLFGMASLVTSEGGIWVAFGSMLWYAIWLGIGALQVRLAMDWTERSSGNWNTSMFLSGLQALTCNIFGIVLFGLHFNKEVQRDLQP